MVEYKVEPDCPFVYADVTTILAPSVDMEIEVKGNVVVPEMLSLEKEAP